MKTAIDIILEGVSNGSITKEDAKILLDAINQKGGTTFVPTPYYTYVDWTYRPYEQPHWTITSNNTNNTDVE